MLFKKKNEIEDNSSTVGTLAVDIVLSTVIFAFLIFVAISFKSVFVSVSNVFFAFGIFLKNYTLLAVIGIAVLLYVIRILSRSGSIFRIRRESKEKKINDNKKSIDDKEKQRREDISWKYREKELEHKEKEYLSRENNDYVKYTATKTKPSYLQRKYSKEEMDALFDNKVDSVPKEYTKFNDSGVVYYKK